ncbi:acetyltransferase [Mesorhizobium sp.]|uniref:acetyltransferase n=1 Tax=Mesorhizobium sp. TaxID=1871066 RepID=UPI000FE8330A|nr:acetyltransferase [Mesorhizobium sp.]RWB56737.1 MAG: acetyltransferase [Mesorhizobium sp.]
MDKLVVFGASGHAAVVIDAAEKQGLYLIAGLITNEIRPSETFGYDVLGRDDDILDVLTDDKRITAAIVAIGDNAVRQRVADNLSSRVPDLSFATVVHPSAVIGNEVRLGAGSFVAAGAVIGPRTSVGRHCIINTRASIDHDCDIQDFASIAPAAVAGGKCSIGWGAAIGIGATLTHGRTIGSETIIGAGALVLRDVQPRVVAYGSPATVIRDRVHGDRYL